MPRATTNINDTERFELKTCPDGFVVLRRLSYGQYLARREMIGNMKIGGSGKDNFEGEIAMANRKVTEFEFQNSIVDHNLEDDNGNLLDFSKVSTLHMLDPRVGEEIGSYIDKMNNFDEDLGKSTAGSDK